MRLPSVRLASQTLTEGLPPDGGRRDPGSIPPGFPAAELAPPALPWPRLHVPVLVGVGAEGTALVPEGRPRAAPLSVGLASRARLPRGSLCARGAGALICWVHGRPFLPACPSVCELFLGRPAPPGAD